MKRMALILMLVLLAVPASAESLPYTIRIYNTTAEKVEVVPLQLYTKRVLPNEWIVSTSPEEALKAGAVAVKMYGWYHNINPKRPDFSAHLLDSAADQTYNHYYDTLPSVYKAKVDDAVESTWLVGMKRDGEIFAPEYWDGKVKVYRTGSCLNIRSSPEIADNVIRCVPDGTELIVVGNGTTVADGWRWWEVVDGDGIYGWAAGHYLQAYTCSGQPSVNDVGVGRMTQEGSVYWANQGMDYRQILSHFYNVEFFDITPPSPEFEVGDRVRTTDPLNVREEAWIGDNIIWTAPEGSSGRIIAADPLPQSSQGYTWWKISYDSGFAGWSSQHRLEKVTEPVITSSLKIIQSPPYYSGDTLTATFTITNRADVPFEFDVLTVGGRDPDDRVSDFEWHLNITLEPGESYSYEGNLTLAKSGNYHFFCAYRINGSWNTAIPAENGVSNVLDITVNPSPSPAPTATPTATPTPSATPIPSPSPAPTATPTATPTPSATPIPSPSPAPTATPTATPTTSPTPAPSIQTPTPEAKFRVGPTVLLRPVVDVIKRGQDGIVEVYIENPSLNDVLLRMEMHVSVPSGIHIYAEEHACAVSAGVAYCPLIEVPPGSVRTIALHIKADENARIGSNTLHFSGLYYPDENKDLYSPVSLTYSLRIEEPSIKADEKSRPVPGFEIMLAIGVLAAAYLLRGGRK